MTELTIRRATQADEETLVAYNRALAEETEKILLDEATVRVGVRAVLNDAHKGFYVVAEARGRVVGQLLITYEWSDWRNGWFWWIQSVYVHPEARRGGVFRRLFEHIQASAQADPEVIGIRLYLEDENHVAHRTYASLGMIEEPYGVYGLYPLPGRASMLGKC